MSDPRSIVEYMNDILTLPPPRAGSSTDDLPEPTERLEARICELAGHPTAATCQFLLLVADFDARRGWATWNTPTTPATTALTAFPRKRGPPGSPAERQQAQEPTPAP